MLSARFDGGHLEQLFREARRTQQCPPISSHTPMNSSHHVSSLTQIAVQVYAILKQHDYNVRMVHAGAGEDFGAATMEYLGELFEQRGILLPVCSSHYAEMTGSKYSSFKELVFAYDNDLQIVPLRVSTTYPPCPPHGESHPYNKKGQAIGYVRAAMPSSVVYIDCLDGKKNLLKAEDIAVLIAERLRRGIEAGHLSTEVAVIANGLPLWGGVQVYANWVVLCLQAGVLQQPRCFSRISFFFEFGQAGSHVLGYGRFAFLSGPSLSSEPRSRGGGPEVGPRWPKDRRLPGITGCSWTLVGGVFVRDRPEWFGARFLGQGAVAAQGKYSSVTATVEMLNRETHAVPDGYCVVFSTSQQNYFLLWREDKKAQVVELLDIGSKSGNKWSTSQTISLPPCTETEMPVG
eukprot:s3687_g8.t3